ncbi:MAG TPA: MFS transporter [Solirubrobacterales bacterium]|nr:MFS transporter [Solirubrobacterales bacterium]
MIGQAARQVAISLRAVGSVFTNPEVRRLQIAWAASSFALWSFAIALGVYAFNVGGAAAVGVAAMVRLLPGAFVSPIAGLLGDRHSRRSILLGSTTLVAVTIGCAAVAVAAGTSEAIVFALAGMVTIASSPYVPAEGALLPAVVRSPQELSAANVARGAMDNVGFLAGATLSGLMLATTSPEAVFAVAAGASLAATVVLLDLRRDRRPSYTTEETRTRGALHETGRGVATLIADRRLRLVGSALTLLVLFEGAADVLIVIVALDLLGLSDGSVGYLNAAWGIGALLAAAPLALLLERGHLAAGLVAGSLVAGASLVLPGIWVAPVAAYLAWFTLGIGYDFVEVAARTLLQRLGSDEVLARVLGTLETLRFAAMATGSIAAPALVSLFGIEGALFAIGAILPLFAVVRWSALRSFEIGSPVEESHFRLLRANPIFAPLPLEALERLSRDVAAVDVGAGEEIITQGEVGDRFYLIESGEVEVIENGSFRRRESAGESFGEIALLQDVARTATVRATRATTLLALDRDHFLSAVTGHHRSHEAAVVIAEERLGTSG